MAAMVIRVAGLHVAVSRPQQLPQHICSKVHDRSVGTDPQQPGLLTATGEPCRIWSWFDLFAMLPHQSKFLKSFHKGV
jgi:hypothetical protein